MNFSSAPDDNGITGNITGVKNTTAAVKLIMKEHKKFFDENYNFTIVFNKSNKKLSFWLRK